MLSAENVIKPIPARNADMQQRDRNSHNSEAAFKPLVAYINTDGGVLPLPSI